MKISFKPELTVNEVNDRQHSINMVKKMFLPVLALCLLFTSACKETDENLISTLPEKPVMNANNADISAYDIGVIHNDMLTYIFNQEYDTTLTDSSLISAIVTNAHNYIVSNGYCNATDISQLFPENTSEDYIYSMMDINENNFNFYNNIIENQINNFNSQQFIFDKDDDIIFTAREQDFLLNALNDIFNNDFSGMNYEQVFNSIKSTATEFMNEHTSINWLQGEGNISMLFLSTAFNSANYWNNEWSNGWILEDTLLNKQPPNGLAPAATIVIHDAIGAALGACVGALESKSATGEISWKKVVGKAIWGGVSGSIGGALNAAKAAGKFISGLFH